MRQCAECGAPANCCEYCGTCGSDELNGNVERRPMSCAECDGPCVYGFPADTGVWYCGACWTEYFRRGLDLHLRAQLRGALLQEVDAPWVLISDFLNEFRW